MRVFAKLPSGCYVIPCNELDSTIADLKKNIIKRHVKPIDEGAYRLVLAGNGAVLGDSDLVKDVLQDGDVLELTSVQTGESCASISKDNTVLPVYDVSLCQSLADIDKAQCIELDGNSLSVEDLIKIGNGQLMVKLSQTAIEAINKARSHIDGIVREHKVVYGVTTGFGKFARVVVEGHKLVELQESLIRSHAAGVGPPLTPQQTRRLMALRINVLAKGFSGIRLQTVQCYVNALNASCLSYIPEKGTVGASGDLAPLSHLALGMMGEGLMWSPTTGWAEARHVLSAHTLHPITLAPKEGLSLINGTQFMTAIGSEAVHRAEGIALQADVIAALSVDVLCGTPRAYDPDIHCNRPHPGQQAVAARLRALLDSETNPSEIRKSHAGCDRVQDPYTMRCIPQVHGVVNDTIKFVKGIVTTEMNSALDNPMVLADRAETISGGNFHGEYPAKALDYLAIGVHELANMSERRQERLINPFYSDMPAFLVKEGGLNSGFMIAHCTSAALVSENKVLTHPSSVDSISTSAGTEDHVSMGGFAARKALQVVEHVEQVMAIELLSACQGLEFHRPKKTTKPLEEVYTLVRTVARPWDKDRFFAPDIDAVAKLLREQKVWDAVKDHVEKYEPQFPKYS